MFDIESIEEDKTTEKITCPHCGKWVIVRIDQAGENLWVDLRKPSNLDD